VTFLANGPAVLAGNFLAGRVVEAYQLRGVTQWTGVWLVPLVGYLVVFAVFFTLFREPSSLESRDQRSAAGQ
jgi:hypothetical protein